MINSPFRQTRAGCFVFPSSLKNYSPQLGASSWWSVACCYFRLACGSPPAEPHPQHDKGGECAGRIEQGIVRRGCAAGDERLVNFIQGGVSGGAEKCREAPRPAPSFAVAAHASVKQQAKNKVFRKVRAFADEMVDEFELAGGQRRNQPAQDRFEYPASVLRGKSVCRHREDKTRP
jgi:hypothetical protein